MAQLEAEDPSNFEVGASPIASEEYAEETAVEQSAVSGIAFGRFVRLMRRKQRLSVEKLAEDAGIDVIELVEIEGDARHSPEPRTVYQLAEKFNVPMQSLMQLAGLSKPKDVRFVNEAIRFAARSEPVDDLNEEERAALEALVSVLSERS